MNALKRLIREIHRRSLWQVLGIYLGGSWLSFEIVERIAESAGLPAWIPPFALVLLVIGPPVVLATAYVQEGAPDVTSADSRADLDDILAGDEQRRGTRTPLERLFNWRNAMLGGASAFVLLTTVALTWMSVAQSESLARLGQGSNQIDADASVERSVVVLPFEDLSPGGDQEYFSDGITDALLNALAQVPDLRVPGRRSSFAFKGLSLPVGVIADSLGVGHVVDGSTRRAGERVLITAQLVDAGEDRQLWSETFERDLTTQEIFNVQDEIARSIVEALQVQLGTERVLVPEPTQDLDAYDLYLQARSVFANRSSVEDVNAAIKLYERAIEVDADYALAYAGAAEAWAVRPNYGTDWAADLNRAEQSARMALSLEPSLVRAQLVLANVHRDRWEWEDAEELYVLALAGLPNDPEMHHEYGEYLLNSGRCAEAVEEQNRALETDPLSPVYYFFLSEALLCESRTEEALAAGRRHQELGYNLVSGLFTLALLEAGRAEEAVAQGRTLEDPWRWFGDWAEAVVEGSELPPLGPAPGNNPWSHLWALSLRGEGEAALGLMKDIVEGRAVQATPRELWMPSVQNLLSNDPRFDELLNEMGLVR